MNASRTPQVSKTPRHPRAHLAAAAILTLAAMPAYGATLHWSGDGISLGGASGNTWDTSTGTWGSSVAGPFNTIWSNAAPDSAVFGGAAGTVNLGANITVGSLTFNTTGYTIDATTTPYTLSFGAGNNTILLNNIAAATINNAVGGTGNVTLATSNPATAGTLTLGLTSTGGWSGTTTIGAGTTLLLNGANRGLANTSAITLNGGNISSTNTNATQAAFDRINNAANITSNGGTFTYTNTSGSSVYAETMGSVGLVRGQTNFNLATNQSNTGSQTLTLSGLTRTGASNSSTVTFSANTTAPNATKNIIKVTGATATPAGQIIGPWATTGTATNVQTKWAVYDGSANVVPDSIADTLNDSTWTTATNAYSLNTGSLVTINTTRTITALRFLGATSTLTLGTGNLETYGLMFTGTNTKTVDSTGGALTTPSGGGNLYLNAGNTGISTISAPINDNSGAVTVVVGNAVGRTLTLSSTTSNYSGGTVLNSGILSTTADANLGSGGGVTVNGTAQWTMGTNVAVTYDRDLTINEGGVLSLSSGNAAKTVTGVLSGSGALVGLNTTSYIFSNTENDFTGTLNNGYEMRFASLGDSANPVNLGGSNAAGGFTWTGGAKTFSSRPFTLSTTGNNQINNNGTGALTIASDIAVSGAPGARTLTLSIASTTGAPAGYVAGTNVLSGNIADGVGSVVTLAKSGAGTWALGGTNTYSGDTNLAASGTTGRLIFQGSQSLSPNTKLIFAQSSSNVQSVSFLDDAAGSISFNRPIEFGGGNTIQGLNIFVGNNNTANGGSSSGNTTGSTIQVGDVTFTSTASDTNTTRINVTGANDYRLQLGTVTLNNLVTRTAGQTTVTEFNPTSANMTVAAVTMATGNTGIANDGVPVLRLDGTTADNRVTGAISNAADYLTGQALSLQKQDASTWALDGENTYTGTTTVTGGTLLINGDTTAAIGAVTVSNANVTLGGSGIIGGSTTMNTGTILSPGNSPGVLTFSQNLSLAGGTGAAGTTAVFEGGDRVDVGGTLTLNTDWNLTLLDGFQDGGTVTLFNYATAGTIDLTPDWNIAGLGFTPSNTLFLTDTGSAIVLNGVSVVPEPTTLGLLAMGAVGLMRRRRVA